MLRKLAALDGRHRILLGLGVCWVIAARITLRLTNRTFPERQRFLDALAGRLPPAAAGSTAAQVAWAVTAAARRLPGTRCLAWSLALRGLLAQVGITSELRIGVAPSQTERITAHAWVQAGGRDWTWDTAVDDFNVLRARPGRP